jgi:hypothetical protein
VSEDDLEDKGTVLKKTQYEMTPAGTMNESTSPEIKRKVGMPRRNGRPELGS